MYTFSHTTWCVSAPRWILTPWLGKSFSSALSLAEPFSCPPWGEHHLLGAISTRPTFLGVMISLFNTLIILYAYLSLHLLRLITDVFTFCLNPYLTFARRRSVEPSLPSRYRAQYLAHSRKTIKVSMMYWKALSIVMKKWQGNTFSHLDVSNLREDRHHLNDMWLETAFTNQVSFLKPEWDTRAQQGTRMQVVSLLGWLEGAAKHGSLEQDTALWDWEAVAENFLWARCEQEQGKEWQVPWLTDVWGASN